MPQGLLINVLPTGKLWRCFACYHHLHANWSLVLLCEPTTACLPPGLSNESLACFLCVLQDYIAAFWFIMHCKEADLTNGSVSIPCPDAAGTQDT